VEGSQVQEPHSTSFNAGHAGSNICGGVVTLWIFFLTMVDDKYMGIALAVSGTFAIGSSVVVTKKVQK
jgi:hypothetical protein